MTNRMREYRKRMKERGLMQVTVWARKEDTQAIRDFAAGLLPDESPTTLTAESGAPDDQASLVTPESLEEQMPARAEVPQPEPLSEESQAVKQAKVTSDKPESAEPSPASSDAAEDGVQGEEGVIDLAALTATDSYREIEAEIASWEQDMAGMEEKARHTEVLAELRAWLEDIAEDDDDTRLSLQHLINERQKMRKKLRKKKKLSLG